MKRIQLVLISLIFLLFNHNIGAEETNKAINQSTLEFEFGRDFIESLGYLKSGLEESKKAGSANYNNETAKVVAIMKAGQTQNYNLRIAQNYVDKYKNSSDEHIKEVAENALFSYDTLIQLNNKCLENLKKLYSPEIMNNPSQFNRGEWMAEASELQAKKDQVMQMLVGCSNVVVVGVLISKTPGEEGKMNYLAITAYEKEELLKAIKQIFGDKVKEDLNDKHSQIEAIDLCGAFLYQFLSKPYKTSDNRPKSFKTK